MATSLLQRLFVSNESDEVVSNEEQEVTTSNNGQKTQIQMTFAHELYAFVADNKNEEELCNNVCSRIVQKQMMLYEFTKRRLNILKKLHAALKTIKPTSVEAERAFSAFGYSVSKIRNGLKMVPLMFCCFSAITIVYKLCLFYVTIVYYEVYCFVNPEKSRDYVMEIPGKSRARDFSFIPKIPSLLIITDLVDRLNHINQNVF